ncbi:MAG: NAD(P)H nitroreductase, partial [Porticoccaceae bacterium]|nr:NAD(P)H nitroreductase [Porticoccaceae bacterium]
MNALETLINRVSTPRLSAPAPCGEILQNIKQAAMRAADHRMLRPWRFLVVEGDSRDKLGQLFVDAKVADCGALSADESANWVSKAHRAP